MPTVSIIIPAHDEERHIERCIQSLLTQDYDDIEIIVVDNGSHDRTPEIIEKYVEKYSNKIRLLRSGQNIGPGGGRNLGALHAAGDILVLVDADMVFPPEYVGRLIDPILRGEALLTTHGTEYVANTDNPWVKVQGQTVRGREVLIAKVFRAVKKDFFIRHGGFDPRLHYHDDRTFFYKTGAKAIVVENAYCYHNNPDTAKEIFRRNYWIGRTYLAVMHREHGAGGFLRSATTLLFRILDLAALPLAAALAVLKPTTTIQYMLLLFPAVLFVAMTLRMRILDVGSLKGRLILRTVYAPLYRILRAAGLLAGVSASLIFGLQVSCRNTRLLLPAESSDQ